MGEDTRQFNVARRVSLLFNADPSQVHKVWPRRRSKITYRAIGVRIVVGTVPVFVSQVSASQDQRV